MRLRTRTQALALRETFRIARRTANEETVVVVALEHDGVRALGEGAPVDYWHESPRAMCQAIEADGGALLGRDLFALEAIRARLAAWDGPQGAKMALDGVAHDWVGKRVGQPVHRLLGTGRRTPPTSYTIGIDTVEGTADRARRARGFEVLKVKVGGPDDIARLEAARRASGARLRVDGNECWTLETLRELMPALIELGVEYVEQPFPADDVESFRALRELTARLPVIVDEGCRDLASVAPIASYADGINIKLAKAGGPREAVRMIHAARALGLHVMLGCMVESALGIAPAAHIASLVDYADLDGHLLLADGPFVGLELRDGRVTPSARPGLGVRPGP